MYLYDKNVAFHYFTIIYVLLAYHTCTVFIFISERKTPDSLSGDLVNGDHLSIPGLHEYSYGSLGAYNQMSPSPKSVAPQSPSSAPRSYTLGEYKKTSYLVPAYLQVFLPTYLPTYRYLPTYLPTATYLPTYLPTYLHVPSYLAVAVCLPTYLPCSLPS